MTSPTPVSKTLISADGTKIYADAVGDPRNPAVVFVHGFSISTIAFNSIFQDPLWTSQVYLIRYDMRGHGRSDKPQDVDSWQSKRLAEDFDAVVEGFKLNKPFVAGWSLGATTITDTLSFHPPSYLSGIIYITAKPHMGVTRAVRDPPDPNVFSNFIGAAGVDEFQTAALGFISQVCRSIPHEFRLALLGGIMVQPRAVTLRVLQRTQDQTGLLKAGKESGLPLLILNGKEDVMMNNEVIVQSVEGWKNLKVVELENADHMPWLTNPVMFREEFLGWVKMIGSGGDFGSDRSSNL